MSFRILAFAGVLAAVSLQAQSSVLPAAAALPSGGTLVTAADDILHHEGIVVADPRFTAPGRHAPPDGFKLRLDSPALGRALAVVAPVDDLSGAPRPLAGPIDLGAYQITQ